MSGQTFRSRERSRRSFQSREPPPLDSRERTDGDEVERRETRGEARGSSRRQRVVRTQDEVAERNRRELAEEQGAEAPEASRDSSGVAAVDREVMATGQTYEAEEAIEDPCNGELRWVKTTKVALRDLDGRIVGLAGIYRDIAESRKVADELRKSQEQLEFWVQDRTTELGRERILLRTLIDNLPDGIYIKDTEGRKTLANPADVATMVAYRRKMSWVRPMMSCSLRRSQRNSWPMIRASSRPSPT